MTTHEYNRAANAILDSQAEGNCSKEQRDLALRLLTEQWKRDHAISLQSEWKVAA